MNKFASFIERLFLLAPDSGDGGSGGESGNAEAETTSESTGSPASDTTITETNTEKGTDNSDETGKKPFDLSNINKPKAAFVSQLSKENQTIEFGENILKLDDLVSDWKTMKESSKRNISVPNKDSSPEEVRSFLDKMGVPESADKYEMEQGNLSDTQYTEIKDLFMKEAFGSALSQGQAKNMWAMINNHFTAQNEMISEMNKNVAETFEARLDKELESESSDPATRKQMANEYANLYKDLVTKDEHCAVFKEFGLNLNPKVIIALGRLNKQISGKTFVSSNNTFVDSNRSSPFGDSFNKTYKK